MPNDVTCLCASLHVLFHLLCTLFYAPISYTAKPPYLCFFFFSIQIYTHTHTLTQVGRQGEWMGFNSCDLDGLPLQFFKTHFTDTTDAIKDPRRSISIQQCLDFALIVHLLWQTSKSEIYRLRWRRRRDVVMKQTGSWCCRSAEMDHRVHVGEIIGAMKGRRINKWHNSTTQQDTIG